MSKTMQMQQPQPQAHEYVCPACNLYRTARQFQGIDEVFETCDICRGKTQVIKPRDTDGEGEE